METVKPIVIEKKSQEQTPSDFDFLRQKGLELLQQLSGQTWTDYNTHDPGVTMLEQLCFAITDLAYRTNFPIEDLLTDIHGNINRQDNSFFTKEQILTTNPVTINDFRKAILDEVEELDNVWIKPVKSAYSSHYAKGLYRITVQVNKATANAIARQTVLEEDIREKVRAAFLSKRNLCEDCVRDIIMLKPQRIYLQSEVLIKEHAIAEEVLAKIYSTLETELNKPVNRFTEKELLEKGLNIEQIYAGPLLKNGFIPDSELRPLKKNIDPSELIKVISQVEGVLYVRNISINSEENQVVGKPFELNENSFPILDIDLDKPGIKLLDDKYLLAIKKPLFETILKKLQGLSKKKLNTAFNTEHHKTIAMGRYRAVDEYYSIQNYFPLIYGLSAEGISPSETENKKARARQLKAYLLFFEQILANYLSQLANIGHLFSTSLEEKKAHSYYFQPLYDVPRIKEILKPYTDNAFFYKSWEQFTRDPDNPYMTTLKKAQESPEVYRERKNRFLDHLLARFNKKVSTYPVLFYYSTYGNSQTGNRISRELKWKASLLRNFATIFHDRIKAYDYTRGHSDISGFEKKISTLLYIQNHQKKPLANVFDTGTIALVAETKPLQQQTQRPYDADQVAHVAWAGEDLPVFIGADEIVQMSEMGRLVAGGINQNEAFIFRHQSQKILVHGINVNNYRIGPDINNERDFVIIYKEPDAELWKTISRHPTKAGAARALQRLILFLKKLSIQSEGFHVMENILLRPELRQEAFGFKFYQSGRQAIMGNNSYVSFYEREKHIRRIVAATKGEKNKTGAPVSFKVNLTFGKAGSAYTVASDELLQKAGELPEVKSLVAQLETFKTNKTHFFPRFEMCVKLSDNTVLKEDFFNGRMTVALPKWPARFQSHDFKAFAEDLFMANVPAHVRVKFMWLSVSEMKKFESIYFEWLDLFKNKASYEERNRLSEKMIHFIKDEAFIIKE